MGKVIKKSVKASSSSKTKSVHHHKRTWNVPQLEPLKGDFDIGLLKEMLKAIKEPDSTSIMRAAEMLMKYLAFVS